MLTRQKATIFAGIKPTPIGWHKGLISIRVEMEKDERNAFLGTSKLFACVPYGGREN